MSATMTMAMTMGKPCVGARAKATRATRASGRRSVAVNASKKYNITILPGDGIGPEIMKVATAALEVAGKKADVEFAFTEALVGGSAIDATGTPLPDEIGRAQSELQSHSELVCRLLLEKKKKTRKRKKKR